jgi:hypothetical protein
MLSWVYGPPTNKKDAIKVIRAAHERGATFHGARYPAHLQQRVDR